MTDDNKRHPNTNRKRNRYIFRTIVLAVLLFAVVFALINNFNKDKETYEVGDLAPDFEMIQINEANDLEVIRLSELQGKGVMLNFWGTFCEPCKDEMPYMESLYPEYRDDVEIVAVSLDLNELIIQKFIDDYNLTFPITHDRKDEVREMYKIGPLPSTIFINPQGEIAEKVIGPLTLDDLEDHFKNIAPSS